MSSLTGVKLPVLLHKIRHEEAVGLAAKVGAEGKLRDGAEGKEEDGDGAKGKEEDRQKVLTTTMKGMLQSRELHEAVHHHPNRLQLERTTTYDNNTLETCSVNCCNIPQNVYNILQFDTNFDDLFRDVSHLGKAGIFECT